MPSTQPKKEKLMNFSAAETFTTFTASSTVLGTSDIFQHYQILCSLLDSILSIMLVASGLAIP